MFYKIKGLGHVHKTAEDIATIPHEVTDSLNDSPGTHIGRDTGLVGKLKIIYAKLGSKENEDDPISQLQNKTTDSNCPIVLT